MHASPKDKVKGIYQALLDFFLAYPRGLLSAFSFAGTMSRRDFGGFFFLNLLAQSFNSEVLLESIRRSGEGNAYWSIAFALSGSFYLWSIVALVSGGMKRYRSMGKRPGLFLLTLIPLVGLPFLLLALVGKDRPERGG